MSQAVTAEQEVPKTVVRNRSAYSKVIHRSDTESEEVRPACPVRGSERGYIEVDRDAYVSHYKLCENPECFGREWR
ncbi:MAG: hypothetical protein J07HX64_00916 [halophilic archaeon J07HX64]|jgi:hypothetical protein|nr:MAG: hypothetical protein J07HX64_00916 [halophilic archaeon J07HX64]